MTVIAITGGRDHTPTQSEIDRFWRYWSSLSGTKLVNGGARGVDTIIANMARDRGIDVNDYPVDHRLDGCDVYTAPMNRNVRMLKVSKAEYLFVFKGGRGTNNCRRAARDLKVEVVEI